MCCCRTPVRHIWYSESGQRLDCGWDQHGFVSWEDSLAEGDRRARIVGNANRGCARLAVWLAWEWLADAAAVVAVETTILRIVLAFHGMSRSGVAHHRLWICVRCRGRIPLHRELTWRAGIGAVRPWRTRLVWAHSPASVLLIRRH